MEYKELLPKKTDHIALSFSGGGFRAASYCLGCLSYLESVSFGGKKLTSLINFISSASGGSITNLSYTASQRNGQSFAEYYKSMNKHLLSGSVLVNRVFEILNDHNCWKERPDKARNIINAFSMAYDELLFKQQTFGTYLKPSNDAVPEVSINTTEFDNGMLFRFQNAGVAGNTFLPFKDGSVLAKIKLADILACSSCFPVGFEPFMFPEDFSYKDLSKADLQKSIKEDYEFSPVKDETDKREASFGLMDGGIDDNQGIGSFMLAEERMQNKNKFGYDLYLACDVSSNYTTGYDFPLENKKSFFGKFSLLFYLIMIVFIFGLSIIGIVTNTLPNLSYIFLGITMVLVAVTLFVSMAGYKAYRNAAKNHNTFGLIVFPHIFLFLKIKLSVLWQLIRARATSAAYLASVVFLKKIRRISYDRLFEKISEQKYKASDEPFKKGDDPSLLTKVKVKNWSKFVLQNALYLLSKKNNGQRKEDLKKERWFIKNPVVTVNEIQYDLLDFMQPSSALQTVATLATDMDTTLWYDANHIKLNLPAALIAAGQFTTCYNLLRYAFRFDGNDPDWSALQNKLVEDWNSFNTNPYWMYSAYDSII